MFDYAMVSQKGDREYNEDYADIEAMNDRHIFALADGLGGHGRGDEASESVVKNAIDVFKTFVGDAKDTLSAMFENAQNELLLLQEKNNCTDEMKSTLTLLYIQDGEASWGHIGDSRIYHFRKGKQQNRTLDHSVPQALVLAGDLKENQIRHHEDRNKLLRVMGIEWDRPRYQLCEAPIELDKRDAFLMCSDGFWEYITEKTMEKYLKKSKSAQDWLELMEKEVIKNGSGCNMDNYTAIAVINKK